MDDIKLKFLTIEVDGEVVMRFPAPELVGTDRHEMIEAILASNPVLRLVDNADVGDIWDGTTYAPA